MAGFESRDSRDFAIYQEFTDKSYFDPKLREQYANYTTDEEVDIASHITRRIDPLVCQRVENKKSHHDMIVLHGDRVICRMDVEAPNKVDRVFSQYPDYSDYWKYHRFLYRKVRPEAGFRDYDIYLQYNRENFNQFWFSPFIAIREKGTLYSNVPLQYDPRLREQYIQIAKTERGIQHYGVEALAYYIKSLMALNLDAIEDPFMRNHLLKNLTGSMSQWTIPVNT